MNWIEIVKAVVPLVLSQTKAAPLAPYISAGIEEAEAIKGATGAEKLAHAVNIAKDGFQAVNAQVGKPVIDSAISDSAIAHGISTAVDVSNLIHKAKQV